MTYSLYGYGGRLSKKEIMAGIESDKSKIVARNTIRYEREGLVAFRLYRTTIVEQTPDGLWIRTGNYHSTLTTGRINMALSNLGYPLSVVRIGEYGYHNTYLKTPTQMVPINGSIFLPKDGDLEERSCSQDSILRKRWLWWTHKYGTAEMPNLVEWDGRASTLRKMLFDWENHRLPWRLLMKLPGFTLHMKMFSDWSGAKPELRYVAVNQKIRLRDLIENVMYAGHIDNLKEKK